MLQSMWNLFKSSYFVDNLPYRHCLETKKPIENIKFSLVLSKWQTSWLNNNRIFPE